LPRVSQDEYYARQLVLEQEESREEGTFRGAEKMTEEEIAEAEEGGW
jgi:hypothetical protein